MTNPHYPLRTSRSPQIALGTNIKLLSRRLGHASSTITLAIYGWLYDSQADAEADTYDIDEL
ncbi:MAG TPA: hypothetical protein VEF89_21530 [Solirubrobacteraceae bacterium]|nr:hypothetical protein [Solirubrobacteraceae bacterium]